MAPSAKKAVVCNIELLRRRHLTLFVCNRGGEKLNGSGTKEDRETWRERERERHGSKSKTYLRPNTCEQETSTARYRHFPGTFT